MSKLYREKYDELCKATGLTPQYNRMAVYKDIALTNTADSGIIKSRGDKRMYTGGILDNGALNPEKEEDFERAQNHAISFYEEIRHRKTDVKAIAENVQWSEIDVQTVKNHIFVNKYDLGGEELESFFPHYDIAVSWQNLIDGRRIDQKDIVLLQHELYEYQLMTESGLNYREAHKIAEEKYNYSKAVSEWRKKHE